MPLFDILNYIEEILLNNAQVAELVDAHVSGACVSRRAGSSPVLGTLLFGMSMSGKRDSNSRPRPWQGRALPTELLPHLTSSFHQRARLCRGDRIRTCGRLVPNQERYRAALHPVAILK